MKSILTPDVIAFDHAYTTMLAVLMARKQATSLRCPHTHTMYYLVERGGDLHLEVEGIDDPIAHVSLDEPDAYEWLEDCARRRMERFEP